MVESQITDSELWRAVKKGSRSEGIRPAPLVSLRTWPGSRKCREEPWKRGRKRIPGESPGVLAFTLVSLKGEPMKKELMGLVSEQEQDETNANKWIRKTSTADILGVWMQIQAMSDATMENGELISRFAQLGLTHAVLLTYGED